MTATWVLGLAPPCLTDPRKFDPAGFNITQSADSTLICNNITLPCAMPGFARPQPNESMASGYGNRFFLNNPCEITCFQVSVRIAPSVYICNCYFCVIERIAVLLPEQTHGYPLII